MTALAESFPRTTAAPPRDEITLSSNRRIDWSTCLGWGAVAGLIGASYFEPLASLAERWANEADYSHGFFVPVFAAYLLWHRRPLLNSGSVGGRWLGGLLVLSTAALRLVGSYYNYVLLEPFSLIPCLAGVALLSGGWRGLRWSWPAI